MTNSKSLLVLLIVLGSAACHETPLVTVNTAPEADARVINMDGKSVDQDTIAAFVMKNPDAGMEAAEMNRFDYNGKDIEVTLDGTHSQDEDGTIVKYEWRSGNLDPDAGTVFGPTPKPVAQPKVTLGEGTWRFVLWVTDNKGKISNPDTVEFVVGKPPATSDPKVAECVGKVLPSVPMACSTCLCAIDDKCRTAVEEPACGEDCWGLIQCIGAKCPDFAAMAMMGDYSCVTGNCMSFVAGGSSGAMGATPCLMKCTDSCVAMSADTDAGM